MDTVVARMSMSERNFKLIWEDSRNAGRGVVTDAFSLEPSTSALHCVGQIHLESVHTQKHLDDAATSIQGSAKRVGTSMVRCAGNVCQ